MALDTLDLTIEDNGEEVTLTFSGVFGVRELTHLNEKLKKILKGPGIFFFFDLEHSSFLCPEYLTLFLEILNDLKSRKAKLILLFSNEENKNYFAPYASIFEIASSRESYQRKTGLLEQLRSVGVYYSKQTGLRVSPLVAALFALLLFGWFLTLGLIIYSQNNELSERRERITVLEKDVSRLTKEIERLESSIGALRNLGLTRAEETRSFGAIRDWMLYLDKLDSLRRARE